MHLGRDARGRWWETFSDRAAAGPERTVRPCPHPSRASVASAPPGSARPSLYSPGPSPRGLAHQQRRFGLRRCARPPLATLQPQQDPPAPPMVLHWATVRDVVVRLAGHVVCDAPTLSSACAPLHQMAHPSWCIRLPLECRNAAPTVLSAQSSVRTTHAFGQQLWAIPHVLARQRLAFEACFRELRLESLPRIIMGRGLAQGSMEAPPVVAAAGNDRGIGG